MERENRKKLGRPSVIYMALVYLFLYMPILVVIMYSFNQNPDNLTFQGFTLKWYAAVLHGDSLWRNMWLSVDAEKAGFMP